ncbi:helix-turn-helix transcriptional regulator [Clostridium sp. MSTE9]|uniref:helix-turn-helix domain-containing protein n=1 Tax=Clostridium sp. (strain MSTE9) TaxID=1105031 RepID=UPI00054F24EC
MKASKLKLELAMARACMNSDDLTKAANLPRPTLNNVITGRNIRPATIGKVARALGVDVADLIESEV